MLVLYTLVNAMKVDATGFDAALPMQSASTLFWIRFWEIALPVVLCFVGSSRLVRYPLTEARAYEIKALLEQRRKSQSAARE
jgi:GPH family glycoside/pentoside/hexuronide:cation symporter